MLEWITSLNEAAACLLTHGLSPLVTGFIPLNNMAKLIDSFGDCTLIQDASATAQAKFLLDPDEYAAVNFSPIKLQDAYLFYEEMDFKGFKTYDPAVLTELVNLKNLPQAIIVRALNDSHVHKNKWTALRNCYCYNAPSTHPCLLYPVWRNITWSRGDMITLAGSVQLRNLSQFVSEHLESDISSSDLCSVGDYTNCLNKMLHLWFACNKDSNLFTDTILNYNNSAMLDFLPCDPAISTVSTLHSIFPKQSEFIDYIDFPKLSYSLRRLMIFVLNHKKTAFCSFIMNTRLPLSELSGTVIEQKWFYTNINLNSITSHYYSSLLNVPTKNILNISKRMKLDTFLEKVL